MDPPPQRPRLLGLPGPCNGKYELPTLDDIREAALSDEYRQFLEETIGRRRATGEEIQSTGIPADPELILQSILGTEQTSQLARKTSFSGAHKVYTHTPRFTKQPVQAGNETEDINHGALVEKINGFWFDTVCNTQWDQVQISDIPTLEQFRNAAIPQAYVVASAVRQWRAEEVLDAVEADSVSASGFNLFESLCTCPELIIEVCKHLKPKDILNLYSMSGRFHDIVDESMWSTVKTWAEHMAPGSVRFFSSDIYRDQFFVRDPVGRPVDSAYYDMSHITIPERKRRQVVNTEVRLVPGLKWLQMVYAREVRIRDILASLARMGHRLPQKTSMTLKKIWLIMDIPTSEARVRLMRSEELITSPDIYLFQMFLIKLMLAFNDPIYGPESTALLELMFGQRSLSALWALLRRKKYTTRLEIRRLKVAYDVEPTPEERLRGEPIYGVPVHQMGLGHLEGWGVGNEHLLRPDELLYIESARRQFDFEEYCEKMMFYGHVDFETGAPLVPTLEEMYMSDDELEESPNIEKHREAGAVTSRVHKECGNVPFERWMWQPRDLKKHHHWDTMTEEEKQAITREEREEFSQTFDVKKWLYNLRYLQGQLTNMLESVKNENGMYSVDIPLSPTGRINGRFDRRTFDNWGTPSGLQTALKAVTDLPFPYGAPEDYNPDMNTEFHNADQPMWLDFSLHGGENPVLDDDELDGWGNNPFDFEAELNRVQNMRGNQDNDHEVAEVETPGGDEEDGEDAVEEEDDEMTDMDEETDVDEYDEYYDNAGGDDGGRQGIGGPQQRQQFAPQYQNQHRGYQAQGGQQQQQQSQQRFTFHYHQDHNYARQSQGAHQQHQGAAQYQNQYYGHQALVGQQQHPGSSLNTGSLLYAHQGHGGQQQPSSPQYPTQFQVDQAQAEQQLQQQQLQQQQQQLEIALAEYDNNVALPTNLPYRPYQ